MGLNSEDRIMAKSISRAVATKPSRIKTAIVISAESFRRLGAACLAEGMTHSEIVEALINRSLSGYVVSVRGERFGPVASTGSATPAAELNLPVAAAG
jgi:hypothetical protein